MDVSKPEFPALRHDPNRAEQPAKNPGGEGEERRTPVMEPESSDSIIFRIQNRLEIMH